MIRKKDREKGLRKIAQIIIFYLPITIIVIAVVILIFLAVQLEQGTSAQYRTNMSQYHHDFNIVGDISAGGTGEYANFNAFYDGRLQTIYSLGPKGYYYVTPKSRITPERAKEVIHYNGKWLLKVDRKLIDK